MAATLITNIRLLVGTWQKSRLLRGEALAHLPVIADAYLMIEDEHIVAYGEMRNLNQLSGLPAKQIDATGQFVLPAWCDSHTHLVFAASRENEFIDKINGLTYAEIAAKGGGILNSAKLVNEATEEELFSKAMTRLEEVSRFGTGAIEIKSGYGLTVEGELKMLRVIKKLKEQSKLIVRSTFLGAHTYPFQFKENHQGYIDSIVHDMLPVIAEEKLADYIDVFCETGFFSPEETAYLCGVAKRYGLKPKLHVNQLNSIGGIMTGIAVDAVSLDHLETMTDEDIFMMGQADAVGTLLPTAAYFLRMPFQPARKLIEAGAAIAIATDYNPGSSPSGNMNMVVSMSCIQMKMVPEEAINAATINGAYAMEVEEEAGSITVGKKANLIFTRPLPSLAYMPYAFGNNHIDKVMLQGEFLT